MLTLSSYSDAATAGKLFPELGPMLYLPTAEGSTTSSSCSPPTQLHPMTSASCLPSDVTLCTQCQQPIHDRYIIYLDGQAFHPGCLRCGYCYGELTHEPACLVKEGQVICKACYPIKYRRACLRCGVVLLSDEYVMRARDSVFHLNCFTCCVCGTQLNQGETFTMNEQADLFCHYDKDLFSVHTQLNLVPPMADSLIKQRSEDSEEQEEEQPGHSRSKRMRTSFKHHQLKAMKLYFTLNHNPDAKDLRQLAQKTGLTKRVLQVWFQNARAKYRRSMQGRDQHGMGLPPPSVDTPTQSVIPQREYSASPKFEPESPKKSLVL